MAQKKKSKGRGKSAAEKKQKARVEFAKVGSQMQTGIENIRSNSLFKALKTRGKKRREEALSGKKPSTRLVLSPKARVSKLPGGGTSRTLDVRLREEKKITRKRKSKKK